MNEELIIAWFEVKVGNIQQILLSELILLVIPNRILILKVKIIY